MLFSKVTSHLFVGSIIALYLLTVTLRLLAIHNGNFPYWFDSGRDARVSRDILEKGDLKIQGPNASGTKDTVYHGVLYYYIIGPLYTWTGGDPQSVLNVLAFLSSLTVVIVVMLGTHLTQSRAIGLVSGVLYATSYDAIRSGTWFSNPIISSLTIPLFFYLIWLVFFEKRTQLFPVLTFVLALCQQALFFSVLLWGVVALAAYLNYWEEVKRVGYRVASFPMTLRLLLAGFITYGIGTATMVLAQLKAWNDGIFSLGKLMEFSGGGSHDFLSILTLGEMIITKTSQSFLPSLPVASILLALWCTTWWLKTHNKSQKQFVLLALTSPLWLLSWHFRQMYHVFIGLEIFGAILLATWLWENVRVKPFGTVFIGVISIIYLTSNFMMWRDETSRGDSLYFVPRGAYYRDQLALIDYTYQQANGQPFSISSFTNPYGYNTLWSYLYSWYGQKKYGYLPTWYGPDQTGLFGEGLLVENKQPQSLHFSIWEPGPGLPENLQADFNSSQTRLVATPSALIYFGTLRLDVRPSTVKTR